MPIQAPNQTYSTTRPQGRIVVLNPTARTLPRAGANGTASTFSVNLDHATANVPTKSGNTFGNNRYTHRTALTTKEQHFGQKSLASIATGRSVAPSYIETPSIHPNAHFFDVARQVKRAPTAPGSLEEHFHPAGVFKNQPNEESTVMPHQRTGIGANQGQNLSKRAVYRSSAGGANKSLPSDTAFHKIAVKRRPSRAQTTGVPPQPDSTSTPSGPRFGKVSFGSIHNLWYDANASFNTGVTNVQTGRTGTGRWNIIKRGAAG